MKLSAAMRAPLPYEEAYAEFCEQRPDGKIGLCPLGWAYTVSRGEPPQRSHDPTEDPWIYADHILDAIRLDYVIDLDKHVRVPTVEDDDEDNNLYNPLYLTITSLRDEDRWSREQIADWLEALGY